MEEIINAIKALKNNKALGPDNLSAKLLKTDPATAAQILLPSCPKFGMTKGYQITGTRSPLLESRRKAYQTIATTGMIITLLSIPSKILAKIAINRLSSVVDSRSREEQAGFRKGKGCIHQIFTLRNVTEQCTGWQRKLYINFVDFEKAFDSIHRNSLWKILRHYGTPQEIGSTYKVFTTTYTAE